MGQISTLKISRVWPFFFFFCKLAAIQVLTGCGLLISSAGDTPFHLAIEKHAHDLIKLFSEKNGDIFVTNKAKEPVWQASLEAGKENETTQDLFFSCQKVKDDREFLLKKDFPFRAEAESVR